MMISLEIGLQQIVEAAKRQSSIIAFINQKSAFFFDLSQWVRFLEKIAISIPLFFETDHLQVGFAMNTRNFYTGTLSALFKSYVT